MLLPELTDFPGELSGMVTALPAVGSAHGLSMKETSLVWMPESSVQGRIYSVFRNRLPMGAW